MISSGLRSTIAKVSIVGAFASAALAGVTPPALAAGTSGTTNGCYSTWGSTGSNAHCTNPSVSQDGNYRNYGNCYYSSDQYSGWVWFGKGSYVDGWGQVDCTFSINYSYVLYS